jgi:beta-galactosidase GanA
MWPQDSANYYSSGVIKTDFTEAGQIGTKKAVCSNHYKAFMGYYEVLQRSHIRHSIIEEDSILNDDLSKYDLLILPVCACMRDEVANKIRDFVAKGGNLISEFDTGYYNEYGTKSDALKLAVIQGIEKVNGFVEYTNGIGTGYQRVTDECAVTEGLSRKYTPAPVLAGCYAEQKCCGSCRILHPDGKSLYGDSERFLSFGNK